MRNWGKEAINESMAAMALLCVWRRAAQLDDGTVLVGTDELVELVAPGTDDDVLVDDVLGVEATVDEVVDDVLLDDVVVDVVVDGLVDEVDELTGDVVDDVGSTVPAPAIRI